MKLSELFKTSGDKNSQISANGQSEKNEGLSPAAAYRLGRQIKALVPGQTLQGEVVGIKGNELQLKIAGDMVLSARLEREVSVDTGKIMTFEVKNNGSLLSLCPLFENMATDGNVLKALDMARLPLNDATIAMTEEMMKQGMSIDKGTLQAIFRDISVNPGASLSSVIQLHQLKMPVNQENIAQMDNYKALQHQLLLGMTNVVDELSMDFQSLLQNGTLDTAVKMYVSIAETFTASAGQDNAAAVLPDTADGSLKDSAAGMTGQPQAEDSGQNHLSLHNGDGKDSNVLLSQDNVETAAGKENSQSSGNLQQVLSLQELENFTGMLRELTDKEANPKLQSLFSHIQDGTATAQEVFQTLTSAYSDVDIQNNVVLSKIFGSKEYNKLLRAEIMNQWTLEPEAVQNPKHVEELYHRLTRQLHELREALVSSGGSTSETLKSVTNLQKNVDFMNQLNQVYTYVQLPLKMNSRDTHGELYVYTNKKHLAQADGNVSALLHLDMEHLGAIDVYVAMQQHKVKTQFYLSDEEMIDFIGQHIHILSDRLEKRGYSMQCEMINRGEKAQEKANVIDRILEENTNSVLLSKYAFDVRA